MMSRERDAIQPTRMPARLYALDIDPVTMVLAYGIERSDGGNLGSAGPIEWNRGR